MVSLQSWCVLLFCVVCEREHSHALSNHWCRCRTCDSNSANLLTPQRTPTTSTSPCWSSCHAKSHASTKSRNTPSSSAPNSQNRSGTCVCLMVGICARHGVCSGKRYDYDALADEMEHGGANALGNETSAANTRVTSLQDTKHLLPCDLVSFEEFQDMNKHSCTAHDVLRC